MDNASILEIMKQDIGISVELPPEREAFLTNYIELARAAIAREGITVGTIKHRFGK